jgi:hypothetical protein
MSSELINRSPDLARLRNEGYEVKIQSAYLLISHVPYVNAERRVEYGTLVSELKLAGDITDKPTTHVALFIGSQPCNADGSVIQGLQHGEGQQDLGNGLIANRSFSNKPPGGYPDYYAKMKRYVTMISDPARGLDPSVTAQTYEAVESPEDTWPFVYLDTNSSRAYIGAISAKLEQQRIAIVGLGGTGSNLLDLLAKTPVREIHLFDADHFLQHNAFRAPGAASLEELRARPLKVEYLKAIYTRMHRGIVAHAEYLSGANVAQLEGFDYVFLCMDATDAKREIIEFLANRGITVIDAGVGVQAVDDKLLGMVRTTTITAQKKSHWPVRISCVETADDDYASNIQIAELNMFNAVMAVIRWKKLAGFYVDYEHEHHSLYTLSGNMLLNEETGP